MQELLSCKLQVGWRPKALLQKLEMAVEKLYTPHSKNEDMLELSLLVKSLGGPKLLYAAHKAAGLVSGETLRRKKLVKAPKFLCTAHESDIEETVRHNLEQFIFSKPTPAPADRCIWALAIDDVAADD